MTPTRLRRHGFLLVLAVCGVALSIGLALVLLTDSMLTLVLGAVFIAGAWIVPVLYAVRYRTRAQFRKTASGEDVRQAQKATVASVEKARQALLASQNRQERTLARIEEHVRGLTVDSQARSIKPGEHGIDVLFVTSNGAGLGHITRAIAIAHELPGECRVEILTLSTAYRSVDNTRFPIHYFPSSQVADENPKRWNQYFLAHLGWFFESRRPKVVVFDGSWVYSGLADACKRAGIPLIWVQRAMWRAEIAESNVQRKAAHTVSDVVIVPGDYAGNEAVDTGGKVRHFEVGPIVQIGREDLLPREESCLGLGLDPEARYVLVSAGGGSLGESADLESLATGALRELAPNHTPVVVRSPLSGASTDAEGSGVKVVQAYPIMRYARSFDFAVCAAGYNSAQEVVALGLPSILIPNPRTKTDDQRRRASELAMLGLCFAAESRDELRSAVSRLSDEGRRGVMLRELDQVPSPTGANEAAVLIQQELVRASWPEMSETKNTDIAGPSSAD